MTLRHLIAIDLLLLVCWPVHAQTAEQFFNSGAQCYITNNIPAAWQKVESGRKLHPHDEKLKELEALLKQQQKSQQNRQNQRNQKQQAQNKPSQQKQQSEKSNSRRNSPQQKPQQAQNRQNQANRQKQPQQKPQQARSSAEQGNEKKHEGQRAKALAAMTPREARQLLNAQKDSEQFLQLKPKETPQNSNTPLKDW